MQAKRKYEILDVSRESFGHGGSTRRGGYLDSREAAEEAIVQIISRIPPDYLGADQVFTIREVWVAERSGT